MTYMGQQRGTRVPLRYLGGSGEETPVDPTQALRQSGLFIELYLFYQNILYENF